MTKSSRFLLTLTWRSFKSKECPSEYKFYKIHLCCHRIVTVLFLHELLFYTSLKMYSCSLDLCGKEGSRVGIKKGFLQNMQGLIDMKRLCCEHNEKSLHNAEQEGCCLFYLPFIPSFERKEFVLFGRIFLLMKQNTENKSWQLNIYFLVVKMGKAFLALELSINWCMEEWTKSLLNWISCLSQIVIANATHTQKEILDSSICST